MQCGENNSLSVIVIIKFNHILNCNHEVVMNKYMYMSRFTRHPDL